MGIAENLKALRKARKLSQEKLAAMADVKQQLISQLERGENLTTKKLPAIALALGVDVGELDPAYVSRMASTGDPEFDAIIEQLDEAGKAAVKRMASDVLALQERAAQKP